MNETHHYETTEVKNISGVVIVKAGLTCESDYSVTFYDTRSGVIQPSQILLYQ